MDTDITCKIRNLKQLERKKKKKTKENLQRMPVVRKRVGIRRSVLQNQ